MSKIKIIMKLFKKIYLNFDNRHVDYGQCRQLSKQ